MAGRPPFKPTPAMRRRVASAKAGGMSEDAIALALGITRPTLAKHFMTELTAGAAAKRLEAMDALFLQAKKGNVSAISKVLLLNAAMNPPAPAPQPGSADAPPAPAPAARLGKKEAAQAAAVSAQDGTEWDDLLPRISQLQ